MAWRVRTPGALDPKAYGSFLEASRDFWASVVGVLRLTIRCFFSFVAIGVVKSFRCLAGQALFGHILSWHIFGHIVAIICENECDKL